MKSAFFIRPLTLNDLPNVKKFTDRAIGKGYFSLDELEQIFKKSLYHQSKKDEKMMTLVLAKGKKIYGVRITYPPGQWSHGKGRELTPEKWPHLLTKTAYFQSLFIDPDLTTQGWGTKMSLQSIEELKKIKAQGIACHSWKDSPQDSSGRYLRSLGFKRIATHLHYWKEVDYACTRCGKPCLCTAEEMYLDLFKKGS